MEKLKQLSQTARNKSWEVQNILALCREAHQKQLERRVKGLSSGYLPDNTIVKAWDGFWSNRLHQELEEILKEKGRKWKLKPSQ